MSEHSKGGRGRTPLSEKGTFKKHKSRGGYLKPGFHRLLLFTAGHIMEVSLCSGKKKTKPVELCVSRLPQGWVGLRVKLRGNTTNSKYKIFYFPLSRNETRLSRCECGHLGHLEPEPMVSQTQLSIMTFYPPSITSNRLYIATGLWPILQPATRGQFKRFWLVCVCVWVNVACAIKSIEGRIGPFTTWLIV